jgi:hypothetical protein
MAMLSHSPQELRERCGELRGATSLASGVAAAAKLPQPGDLLGTVVVPEKGG